MKQIFLTGSASREAKVKILNSFGITNTTVADQGLQEFTFANGNKLIVYTDLNRLSFNQDILQKIFDGGIDNVIMIETFNPRPETLLNDLKKLRPFANKIAFKDKLDIIHRSNFENQNMQNLREIFLSFDIIYDYLKITIKKEEKQHFVNNHVHSINTLNHEDYQKFINKMGFTQALSSGETINSELKNHQNQSQGTQKTDQILGPEAAINQIHEINNQKINEISESQAQRDQRSELINTGKTNNPVIDKNESTTKVKPFQLNNNKDNTEINKKNVDNHKQTNISKSNNSFIKKAFIACICAIVLTAIIAAIIYVAIPSLFSVGAIAIAGVASLALTSAITGIVGKEKEI